MKTKEHHIVSRSPEETFSLGTFFGKYLTSGSVVALTGELGSGKTCLTAGIAKGLGVPQDFYVTSPSFVLVNEYPGRTQLFHVDLYRIQDPVELEDIGLHEMLVSNGVTVIEWAERMGQDLPKERLGVAISVVDDHTRNLHL
ncbi:MAG: tRNA (adenosine(37)-N6)-threonylcarbamoyltransferase complex ATPase subunit type 1 TsaE, partial [Deltaproteobacteria bacterium]